MSTEKLFNTYLFLDTCRQTLSEIVDLSDLEKDEKKILSKFFKEQASDYQVLSLVVKGQFPLEESNPVLESYLFDDISREGTIYEFSPLYEWNISSQKAIRNFILENHLLEQEDPIYTWQQNLKNAQEKQRQYRATEGTPNEQLQLADANVQYAQAKLEEAKVKSQLEDAKRTKSNTNVLQAKLEAAEKKSEAAKNDVDNAYQALQNMQTQRQTSGGEKLAKSVVGFGVSSAASSVQTTVGGAIGGAVTSGLSTLWKAAKGGVKAVMPYIIKLAKSQAAGYIGGALLIALIAYAARRAYMNAFKKAEMACRGMSGQEKNECIYRYKETALNQQLSDLKTGMGMCNYSKDPVKCKQQMMKKIQKVGEQLKDLREKRPV